MSTRANVRLPHRSVSYGQQDEMRPQLSLRRPQPATASPRHQMSYEAQLDKLHAIMLIRAPRRPMLLGRSDFSTLAGTLQRLDLLEMKATIRRRSKPALLIHPPPVARAHPMVAKAHSVAVPYPTAITQTLSTPAIHRAPTTAMSNFSRERGHSSFVRLVTTSEPL
jgi:hypothetical protein